MSRWLAASFLALVVPLFAGPGCDTKPAEGKSCDEAKDSVICLDPKTRLACEGGKWTADTCLGPKGCEVSGMFVKCDTSIANEASACGSSKGLSCTPDKKSMLRCTGGKWTVAEKCLGEDGCDASSLLVRCDSSIANEGDVCEVEPDSKKASYACAVDRKSMLACVSGKWKKLEACAGPEGCHGKGLLSCDGPTAAAGDFCLFDGKDDYACSADKKTQLKCEAGGWKAVRQCLGADGCSSSVLGVKCDQSVQEPGAACEKDGAAACSTDKKTILECKGGKFQKSRACPGACKATTLFIECE